MSTASDRLHDLADEVDRLESDLAAVEHERDELRAIARKQRAALESIRLHAEGQVSQYARARESVISIVLSALALGDEDPS